MHNAAFEASGLDLAYIPLPVQSEDLPKAIEALRVFGFRGANVTLPHKQAVIPYLDEISELSKVIGAVNTIVQENGRLIGTTTDPIGFREGFRETGLSFKGKSIAVLGNGGSARTIAFTLFMMEEPASVALVARNRQKSQVIADEIKAALGKEVTLIDMDQYAAVAKEFQIVVNTTPVGMIPDTEKSPLTSDALSDGQVIYDIVYTPERTKLIRLAQQRKLNTVGGLGMLVHQGAASYKIWTGLDADVRLYYNTLRKALRKSFLSRKDPLLANGPKE
jgi:shikimate dehydrogenase